MRHLRSTLTILAILFFISADAQLTGNKNIPGDYATIADAVTALNAQGVGGGGVNFLVAAGHSETSDVPEITASGSAANPIVFIKSGTGANPIVTRLTAGTVASTTTLGSHGDGIIVINGGDYITFNGIDLRTNNTFTGNGLMEYGYYLKKASGTDACQNVTIANANITLNKTARYSAGVFVSNITGTATATVTSTSGRSENIKIYGNNISNVYVGVHLRGFNHSTAPNDLYDQNNEVGVTAPNTITDFGGGASAAYGIYTIYQNGVKISNNNISGGAGTTTTLYGIFLSTATNVNADVVGNTIQLTSASTTSSTYGINNGSGTTGTSNTINIQNNIVENLSWPTSTSGDFYGIYQSTTPMTVNISGNIVRNNSQPGTGTAYYIYNSNTAANGTANIFNNTVDNNSVAGSSTMYGINSNPVSTSIVKIYGNTVSNLTNGGNTIYGIYKATGETNDIYRNKVYNLTSNGTGGDAYGIYTLTGNVTNVYNNLIGDLKTPAATTTNNLVGLYISSGTTVNATFNTIYLNGTSSSATNFGSSGIYIASVTPIVELKNNIVVNISTPLGTGVTAALRRGTTDLTTYSANSNNNIYYAGAPSPTRVIFTDGTNTDQTLSAFQARVNPAESASKTELPPFISLSGASADFLHIDPTIATRAEGGGQPVSGITLDYDQQTRNAGTPDIGADEFNGTPLTGCSGMPTAGTITGSNTVCFGFTSTLTLSGHSVGTGITYQWQSSATSGSGFTNIAGATGESYSTSNLTSNTYYRVVVTCTNTGDVINTPEFTVSVNASPIVTAVAANPVICNGGSTTLTASGASTYVWSPSTGLSGTTGATVTSTTTASRNYQVIGTDANGCKDTTTVFVMVNPAVPAAATATLDVICNNGTSQLNATTTYLNYTATAIPLSPVTPTAGTTVLAQGGTAVVAQTSGTLDDGRWANIAIPFTFRYFGTDYTALSISTNGFITFGTGTQASGFNVPLPSTSTPNNTIHALTADLDFRAPSTGTIEYFVEGTSPNRKFIVNFTDASFFDVTLNDNPGSGTVQVVLNETTNEIEIHTVSVTNTTVNKAQGLENSSGSIGVIIPGRNNTANWGATANAYKFSLTNLTYSWSPTTFLNNANISNPVASNMTATTTYTVTITDPSTGCFGTATATVTVGTPLVGTAAISANNVCYGAGVTLTATASGGGEPYTYSWSDGTSVLSTAQSFIDTPEVNTTYTLTVTDACGTSVNSQVTVNVNNPGVTSTTAASRCGVGTVTLQATTAAGRVLNWYENATGGSPVGTGTSFTTPTLTSTKTYFVAASEITAAQTGGRTAPSSTSAVSPIDYGLVFDLNTGIVLDSVKVYPATATAGNLVLELQNSAGTVLQTTTVAIPGGNSTTAVNVPVNFAIPSGTGYRLIAVTGPSMVRESALGGFPYALGTAGAITSGYISGTSTSYYYFYNWSFRPNCEGQRVAVIATVNTPPAITVSATANAICIGGTTTISVASSNSGYAYSWSTGATTNSITVNPTVTTKYYVTATDASGGPNNGCSAIDSITITVNGLPSVPVITAGSTTICEGSSTQLNTVSTYGYSPIKITELTQFRTGTGATNPYPATVGTGDDLVEISNLGTTPIDVSGLSLELWNGTAMNRTWNIPAGTILNGNSVMVVHLGTGTDNAANMFFNTGGTSNLLGSNEAAGVVLRSSTFGIIDVVASNSYAWPSVSGVTAAHWSGNVPSSSSDAGIIRSAATDNNTAADWIVSTATALQTIGTYNTGYNAVTLPALNYSWSPATGLSSATIANPMANPTSTQTYTVTVTEPVTGCTSSSNITITVNTPTSIITQPAGQSVCAGSPASLSVVAAGTALTYQWRKGGTPVAGATSATFSIAATTAADADSYDVVVTGACGPVTSTAVSLDVNPIPVASFTSAAGTPCNTITFTNTSTVSSGTIATYLWDFGDGTTASTITNPTHTYAAAGTYNVSLTVTSAAGCSNTVTIAVTVDLPVSITTQPVAQAVCAGANATFTVAASGSGTLTYQWRKGGTVISGATSNSLTISNAAAADAANYDVIITGTCGSITSNAVALSLNAATTITTQPTAQTVCAGANATFTVAATGTGLTYQWRKGGTAISGATSATLTINNAAAADAASYDVIVTGSCGSATSNAVTLTVNAATSITTQPVAQTVCQNGSVTFSVTATGTALTYQWRKAGVPISGATSTNLLIANAQATDASTYDVVVTGNCGNATSTAVSLTVNPATVITGQPAAQTICNGANATFTVTATGVGLTYQWRKGGTAIPGATNNSYTISNATAADAQNYDVIVTGTCGTVTSNAVALTVNTCTSLPVIDTDITSVVLMPNVFENSTLLRIKSAKTTKINWSIVDARGRVVMTFSRNVQAGQTDLPLMLRHLAGGVYYLSGETTKGKTATLRFVKL